jgi:hypothetical protein
VGDSGPGFYKEKHNLILWKKIKAISKPGFSVILNAVKDLNALKIQDSSLRSE